MLDFLELSQTPKKFDIALTWPLPRNGSLAYMCADKVFLDRTKSSFISPLMLVSCHDRNVVVIGDYWNKYELDKLRTVAKSVVVHTHEEEQCNLESIRKTNQIVYHIWNRFSDETSNHYYRGLLYHIKHTVGQELYDYMAENHHAPSEEELVKTGKVIYNTYSEDAAGIVAASSVQMKCNGLSACIVYGANQPVMPLAEAAAREADIGIVVRLFPNADCSRLTFHTICGADLSFVNEKSEYFPGGGDDNTRGCRIPYLLMIDTKYESLEDCIRGDD